MAFAIRVSMAARAPHVLAAAAILVWSGFSHSAFAACVVPSDTAVISVQRIPAPEAGSERLLQLGDRIAIKVKNLGDLLKDPNCTSPRRRSSSMARPPRGSTPSNRRTTATCSSSTSARRPKSAAVWKHVFANPFEEGWQREIALNVGWQDQGAFPGKPSVQKINLFPEGWAFFFLVLLLALLAIFAGLAINSGLLRDSPPPPDTVKVTGDQLDWTQPPPEAGPYSLARTQAAWWLFIILAAYILDRPRHRELRDIDQQHGADAARHRRGDRRRRRRDLAVEEGRSAGARQDLVAEDHGPPGARHPEGRRRARPSFRRAVTPSCRRPTPRRLAPRPPGSTPTSAATPSTTRSPRTRDREASCSTS